MSSAQAGAQTEGSSGGSFEQRWGAYLGIAIIVGALLGAGMVRWVLPTSTGEVLGPGGGEQGGIRVFVANEFNNTLSALRLKIDPVTNQVTVLDHAIIATGVRPHNVNTDPFGRYIYASNFQATAIQVFNATSYELVKTITTGAGAAHVVPSKDGRYLYVSNQEEGTISTIDLATLAVQSTVDAGGKGSHGIVLNPDGSRLYIPNAYWNTVTVMDTASKLILANISVGAFPVAAGVTPDGRFVLVSAAAETENRLYAIDARTNVVVDDLSVGMRPIQMAVHPNGYRLYVPNMDSGDVWVVDLRGLYDGTGMQVITSITTDAAAGEPSGAHGVSYLDGGRYAFVTNTYTDTISVIDTVSNQEISVIDVRAGPNGIATMFGQNQGW